MSTINKAFKDLEKSFTGDIYTDQLTRTIYATDGSAYREFPVAVCRPANTNDIKQLIAFARDYKIPIIPRAAGTSLAGQVVGNGIVADISKYMTRIIEFNKEERWVRVEPGVNLDELNLFLKPHGLLFGPETSTANRCMIGGMVGNNACGLHSLVYGSTRDHTLEVKALLSDGTEVVFKEIDNETFENKCTIDSLEGRLYSQIKTILSASEVQEEIRREYPDPRLERRNTGYAIDILLESEPFTKGKGKFNFCKLIAGSEGTLAFITEIKLNLLPLPAPIKGLLCVHCKTIEDSLKANLLALKYKPEAIELMDNTILQLTKDNIEQRKNRFFVEGDPGALLIIEFAKNTKEEVLSIAANIEKEMRAANLAYHFPTVFGADIKKVWDLRKAGLGVLSNMPGDAKPVSVIEDTSVLPELLPAYIAEFNTMLDSLGLKCVYHAHIATGELHLRPIIDLKKSNEVELFHTVALETAKLVKKYKGSLSGEHGDGRLRGEFIPLMVGAKNYLLLKKIKETWDPLHIFNAGKITDTPPMTSSLRYKSGVKDREIDTIFDFSKTHGILRAAEQCNGSGDCRKSHIIGGTMCPSYMATRDENHVTRARANVLREYLTFSSKKNPFDHKEIYQILDLCISCKACKSECPSNVDVAKLKAEFLQHYYDANGVPIRASIIANITTINKLGSLWPWFTNFLMSNSVTRKLGFPLLGFSPHREMPLLYQTTLNKYIRNYATEMQKGSKGSVYLFNDEFTNYNDTAIGIKTIQLLNKLGYKVIIPKHGMSGRTFLSKGLIRQARKIADRNIEQLSGVITADQPLLGIEPSAILAFRDEYPELVSSHLRADAAKLAKNVMMVDEFIAREAEKGNINKDQFTNEKRDVLLHGHCQQKAISSTNYTKAILALPINYSVNEIPSGCCGMAGSFGFEKEHYEVSMNIGELVLFPAVRKASAETIIVAPGTSCRHQIKDVTGVIALHPMEVLFGALRKE